MSRSYKCLKNHLVPSIPGSSELSFPSRSAPEREPLAGGELGGQGRQDGTCSPERCRGVPRRCLSQSSCIGCADASSCGSQPACRPHAESISPLPHCKSQLLACTECTSAQLHSPLEGPPGEGISSDDHRSDAGYPDASGPVTGCTQCAPHKRDHVQV